MPVDIFIIMIKEIGKFLFALLAIAFGILFVVAIYGLVWGVIIGSAIWMASKFF